MRRRLEEELLRRGLAVDLEQARELVAEGNVLVSGSVAQTPARRVDAAEPVVITQPKRFVGRAGEKLAAALAEFELDPSGEEILDVGASTGGFTDCLLQAGAATVWALDVGHDQLHEKVGNDPRVHNLERTNLRHVGPEELGPFDAVVGDLSFISLTTVMPNILALVRPGGWIVLLVKPQFEAPRDVVSQGSGIVTDPGVWESAILSVIDSARAQRATIIDVMRSPLKGGSGNVEFLLYMRAPDEFAQHHDRVGPVLEPELVARIKSVVGDVHDAVGPDGSQ